MYLKVGRPEGRVGGHRHGHIKSVNGKASVTFTSLRYDHLSSSEGDDDELSREREAIKCYHRYPWQCTFGDGPQLVRLWRSGTTANAATVQQQNSPIRLPPVQVNFPFWAKWLSGWLQAGRDWRARPFEGCGHWPGSTDWVEEGVISHQFLTMFVADGLYNNVDVASDGGREREPQGWCRKAYIVQHI